ncbi:hypothetical protein [Streptomyces sp. NPDC002088]
MKRRAKGYTRLEFDVLANLQANSEGDSEPARHYGLYHNHRDHPPH